MAGIVALPHTDGLTGGGSGGGGGGGGGSGLQWVLESSDGIVPTLDFRNSPQNLDTPPATISLSEGVTMEARELIGTMTSWSITSSGILWPQFSTSANNIRYAINLADMIALGGGPAHSLDDHLFWVWVCRNTTGLTIQPNGDYFTPGYQTNPRTAWAFAPALDSNGGTLRVLTRSNTASVVAGDTGQAPGPDIFLGCERLTGAGGSPQLRAGYSLSLPASPDDQAARGASLFVQDTFGPSTIAAPYLGPSWNDNGGADPSMILESLYLYRLREA